MNFLFLFITCCFLLLSPAVFSEKLNPNPYDDNRITSRSVLSSTDKTEPLFLYQSGITDNMMSGSLKKWQIGLTPQGLLAGNKPALWDAGDILTENTPARLRTIATYDRNTNSTIEFFFNKQLPPNIKLLLDKSPVTGKADGQAEQRINYLRGERRNERPAGPLRQRNSLLGSIVHSTPVYAAGPDNNRHTPDYQNFYQQYMARSSVIYVGANDGMLHAFDAGNGQELFAYIPGSLLEKLPRLSSPDFQNQIFVDGNIVVTEARVNRTWKTILASGMGNGARGIFVLDVTTPSGFLHGDGVLFEFSDLDDPAMSYVHSAPVIAPFHINGNKTPDSSGHGNNTSQQATYFVIVTTADTLFLLSLDKKPHDPWILNTNYYKLTTPQNADNRTTNINAPGLAFATDGTVNYAYTGDSYGILWRIDFSSGLQQAGSTAIFSVKNQRGTPQSFTTATQLVLAPGGGYLILAGVGQQQKKSGLTKSPLSSGFYAIHDIPDKSTGIKSRESLVKRTLTPVIINTVHGSAIPDDNSNDINDKQSRSEQNGWFIDFPDNCLLSAAVIHHGILFFNTTPALPAINKQTTGIKKNTGSTRYRLNVLTGKAASHDGPAIKQGDISMAGTPLLINTGRQTSTTDAFGRRHNKNTYTVIHTSAIHLPDTGNQLTAVSETGSTVSVSGRLSWKEIQNWHELRKEFSEKKRNPP